MNHNLVLAIAVAAIALSCHAAPTMAQEQAPTSQRTATLEDVVVTAQKRSESLSKTPVAVTALSQEQLTTSGVNGLKDLSTSVPNLEMGTNGLYNSLEATIRGISTAGGSEDVDPSVSIYVDGVYVPRLQGMTAALYDVERVEVLRGPQGTLYGRNSTAGSINILTASPTNEFGAKLEASYGNYADVQTHAMVNLPLTDTLTIRASATTHRNDGYFDTLGTTSENYGRADDYGGRLNALWHPRKTITWRLSFDDYQSHGTPDLGIDTAANGLPADGYPVFRRPVNSYPEPYNHISNRAIRSRLEWQFADAFSVSYVAGWQQVKYDTQQNSSGTTANILDTFSGADTYNTYHEIDLRYARGRWKIIAGGTFLYETFKGLSEYPVYSFDADISFIVPATIARAYGSFAQATYSLTDALRLTAGARESVDTRNKVGKLEVICPLHTPLNGFTPPSACSSVIPIGSKGRWSQPTWKLGAEYDLNANAMTYAAVSTGYKAGGNSDGPPSPDRRFLPEHVINYEMGLKTRLLDNRLSINTTAFYMDYTDLQVSQIGYNGGTVIKNAAQASVHGIEAELSAKITARDRVSGFIDNLHATYDKYENAVDAQTQIVYPNLSGHVLPKAPQVSGSLRYEHDFEFANGGTLSPSFEFFAQSASYLREFNLPIDRVPSYSKTNVMLTYSPVAGHWSFQAYAYNLEGNDVRTAVLTVASHYYSYYAAPRLFGARTSFKF